MGCKEVSIFGSMISPDFFLLLSFKEDRQLAIKSFLQLWEGQSYDKQDFPSTTTTLITITKTAQSKVNFTLFNCHSDQF